MASHPEVPLSHGQCYGLYRCSFKVQGFGSFGDPKRTPNVWNYPNNAFRGLSRWDKGFWFRVLGLGFGRPYFSAIVTRNLDELKLHQASPAYILLGSEFRLP